MTDGKPLLPEKWSSKDASSPQESVTQQRPSITGGEYWQTTKDYARTKRWNGKTNNCGVCCAWCCGIFLLILIIFLPILFCVIIKDAAQSSVDHSHLAVNSASLSLEYPNGSADASTPSLLQSGGGGLGATAADMKFRLTSKQTVSNAGSFGATLGAATVTAYFDGVEFGSFSTPEVKVHSNTGAEFTVDSLVEITNVTCWKQMSQLLFNGQDVTWKIRSNMKLTLDLLSLEYHVDFDKAIVIPSTRLESLVAESPVLQSGSSSSLLGSSNLTLTNTGLVELPFAGYTAYDLLIELHCAPGTWVTFARAVNDPFTLRLGHNRLPVDITLSHEVEPSNCPEACSPPEPGSCEAKNVDYANCSAGCLREIAMSQYVGRYASGKDTPLRLKGPVRDPKTPVFMEDMLGCASCPPMVVTAKGNRKTLLFNNLLSREGLVSTTTVTTGDLPEIPAPYTLTTMYNTENVTMSQSNLRFSVSLPPKWGVPFSYRKKNPFAPSGFEYVKCPATDFLINVKRDLPTPAAMPYRLASYATPADTIGHLLTGIEESLAKLVVDPASQKKLLEVFLVSQCNLAAVLDLLASACGVGDITATATAAMEITCNGSTIVSKPYCAQAARAAAISALQTATTNAALLGYVTDPIFLPAFIEGGGSACSLANPISFLLPAMQLLTANLTATLEACNVPPPCFSSTLTALLGVVDNACGLNESIALTAASAAACPDKSSAAAVLRAYSNGTIGDAFFVAMGGPCMADNPLTFILTYLATPPSTCNDINTIAATIGTYLESVLAGGAMEVVTKLMAVLLPVVNSCPKVIGNLNVALRGVLPSIAESLDHSPTCIANRMLGLSCVAKFVAGRQVTPGVSPPQLGLISRTYEDLTATPVNSLTVITDGVMDTTLGNFTLRGVKYHQDSVPLALDSNILNTLRAWGLYNETGLFNPAAWSAILDSTVLPSALVQLGGVYQLLAKAPEGLSPEGADALYGTIEAVIGGVLLDTLGVPEAELPLCGIDGDDDDAFLHFDMCDIPGEGTGNELVPDSPSSKGLPISNPTSTPPSFLEAMSTTSVMRGSGRRLRAGKLLAKKKGRGILSPRATAIIPEKEESSSGMALLEEGGGLSTHLAHGLMHMTSPSASPCGTEAAKLEAWKLGGSDARTFPEEAKAVGLKDRTMDVGLAFSGGGARAYSAALGALRVLSSKGVMKNIRYISGDSGGAWAASIYSYWNGKGTGAAQPGVSECMFLRKHLPPAALSDRVLRSMAKYEMGRGAVEKLLMPLIVAASDLYLDPQAIWQYGITAAYYSRFGLGDPNALFAYDSTQVNDIVRRNPDLANATFFLPRKERPFMIIHSTLMAPSSVVNETTLASNAVGFKEFQWTPLYSGMVLPTHEERYDGMGLNSSEEKVSDDVDVGGFYETWGLGSLAPTDAIPAFGGEGEADAANTVNATVEVCRRVEGGAPPASGAPHASRYPPTSLAFAGSSSSSWAGETQQYVRTGGKEDFVSGVMDMIMGLFRRESYQSCLQKGGSKLSCLQSTVDEISIWPATNNPSGEGMLFGDGGIVDNTGITSLLQRQVAKVVAIASSEVPFTFNASYDEEDYAFTGNEINGLGQFYGFTFKNPSSGRLVNGSTNLLFEDGRREYAKLVRAFNRLASNGSALVFSADLVTVANAKYGILAGAKTELTWVYPSPASQFTESLPAEVRDDVARSSADPSGLYFKFPNYNTMLQNCPDMDRWMAEIASGGAAAVVSVLQEFFASDCDVESLTPRQVNLLAGFTGWSIEENWADTFEGIFTDTAHPAAPEANRCDVGFTDYGGGTMVTSPAPMLLDNCPTKKN